MTGARLGKTATTGEAKEQLHKIHKTAWSYTDNHGKAWQRTHAAFEGWTTHVAFEKKRKNHKAGKQPCGWNIISMEINCKQLYKGREKSRSVWATNSSLNEWE